VIEAAVGLHQRTQRSFARVAERRVAEIVSQRDRLGKLRVEPERPSHRARDLRGLHRMRQARAVVVTLMVYEDLGLVFKAAKRGGMHDTVAVALERRPHWMGRLRKAPSAAGPRQHRVWRERARLQFLESLSISQHRSAQPEPTAMSGCYHVTRGSPTRRAYRLSTEY
jgi:hypothetical protein